MKWIICFFLLWQSSTISVDAHKFYFSKALLNYNTTTNSFELSWHVFVDDLEDAMKLEGIEGLSLLTEKEHPEADQLIAEYVKNHFMVMCGDEEVPMHFLGKEEADDLNGLWFYMEGPWDQKPTDLTIINNMIVAMHADQKNMLEFSMDDHSKYVLFDKDKIEQNWKL